MKSDERKEPELVAEALRKEVWGRRICGRDMACSGLQKTNPAILSFIGLVIHFNMQICFA